MQSKSAIVKATGPHWMRTDARHHPAPETETELEVELIVAEDEAV